jgi:hypothetical protein
LKDGGAGFQITKLSDYQITNFLLGLLHLESLVEG